jgi:hypothetical protein
LIFIWTRVSRQKKSFVAAILIGVILVTIQVGNIRENILASEGGRFAYNRTSLSTFDNLNRNLQVYLNTFQFSGFVFENNSNIKIEVLTPLYSVLSPLPKFSDTSYYSLDGTTKYNDAIYGGGSKDLIIPSIAEIYLAWGPVLLLIISIFIGRVSRRLFLFARSTNHFILGFLSIYLLLWLICFPSFSLLVYSRILFYNLIFPFLGARLLTTALDRGRNGK